MQQNKKNKGAKNVLMFLLYAGPAVIVFTAVILIAFINGIQLTFTDWNGLTDEYQYIGFSNYADAFRDALFWESLLRTFKYAFGVVVITNGIAFLIAFGLTRGYKGQGLFRASFFIEAKASSAFCCTLSGICTSCLSFSNISSSLILISVFSFPPPDNIPLPSSFWLSLSSSSQSPPEYPGFLRFPTF